jgi:group I intron endonuclease
MQPTVGVYMIRNRKTGHIYCGSSMDCESRWLEHLVALHNKRHNAIFQQAWNIFGELSFDFMIIKHCDNCISLKDLHKLEQYCLDILQPKYNVSKRADGIDANVLSEYRSRPEIKEHYSNLMLANNPMKRPDVKAKHLASLNTPEELERKSKTQIGSHRSEEARERMRQAQNRPDVKEKHRLVRLNKLKNKDKLQ